MKVSERGQVTIPKKFRERLGLQPFTEVEFALEPGKLVLRKKPASSSLRLTKWIGFLKGAHEDVDEFIEEVRGRLTAGQEI